MDMTIDQDLRSRIRDVLLRDRRTFTGSDRDYAATRLRISLNTFKRLIEPDPTPLRIKRQTITKLCREIAIPVPEELAVDPRQPGYGGYTRDEYGFLEGDYVQYRRSWLTGLNVNRSLMRITWSATKGCLEFTETLRYTSDRGVAQAVDYGGAIYMHAERSLCSLLSIDAGEVRLTVVHTPNRRLKPDGSLIKLRGLQLAHAFPKGYFQPSVTSLYAEELAAGAAPQGPGTIMPGEPDYGRIIQELTAVEQDSVINTALLARAP